MDDAADGSQVTSSRSVRFNLDKDSSSDHYVTRGEDLFAIVSKETFQSYLLECDDGQLELEPCVSPTSGHLFIRNLDTGESRRLGEGALNSSFVGKSMQSWTLERSCRPWEHWWTELFEATAVLHKAVAERQSERLAFALKALKESPGNNISLAISTRSVHGYTALHVAAAAGDAESAELLLDAGADVGSCTNDGMTPLHLTCQYGHLRCACLLMDWGAQARAETNDGNTALHFVASKGYTKLIDPLLAHICAYSVHAAVRESRSALLCARNRFSQRPQHVAADSETARLLRAEPDSTNLEDSYAGRSSLNFAGASSSDNAVLLRNSRVDAVARMLRTCQSGSFGVLTTQPVDQAESEAWCHPAPQCDDHGRHQVGNAGLGLPIVPDFSAATSLPLVVPRLRRARHRTQQLMRVFKKLMNADYGVGDSPTERLVLATVQF